MKATKAIPLTLAGLFALAVVFALVGAAGVATWEYTNSDAFCNNACHEVHPENAFAHHASQHAEVACVECHVGRLPFFPSMIEKSGHVSHAWARVFGYERPLVAPSLPAARDSCEGCHTTQPHRHNSLRVRRHFAADERNSETKVSLMVRTVGRAFRGGESRGIDEHIRTRVRFIATDLQKQNIPWVEATRPDGTVTTYHDVAVPMAETAIADAEKRTMECADCHNLVGHPVRDPDELVDAALADGTLDPRFPYIKARAVELLNKEFSNSEEAMALLDDAREQYLEEFPDLPERFPDAWKRREEFLQQRQEQMAGMLLRNQFSAADISWRSFPDGSGHRNSPGCFRCHSGRHQTADGKLIPINCTTCHGIPIVTTRDRIRGQLLDLADMRSPPSHQAQDFVFRHPELAMPEDPTEEPGCDGCHGKIEYGTDDKTFCANSGCHDARLPGFGPT